MTFRPLPMFLSVTAFLEQVPIGRTLLYDQIRQGHIHAVKVGSRTLIPCIELTRLQEEAHGGGTTQDG